MADNEKDSTAGGSIDPSIDLEAASADRKAAHAVAAGGNGSRNKWILGIAIGALVIVAIVAPTVLTVTNKPKGATDTYSLAPGPFNATSKLRVFNEDVVRGYNSTDELKSDVANAAWFLIEQVVQRNDGAKGYESVGVGQSARPNQEAGPASDASSQGQGSNRGAGSDYGTNNQEDLEEGDTLVSDGDYVYSAYSEYLLIWNARNGTRVGQIKMPPVETEDSQASGGANGDEGFFWYPKPEIQNLLLYEGKLLVTVGGYGPSLLRPNGLNSSVLYDFLNTQLRVYETASLLAGKDQPLSTTNLQGAFRGVRALNGNVHIMTTTGINTYDDLIMPFETDPASPISESYVQDAYTKAQEDAVPHFVEKVVSQIGMGDSGAPKLVKISLFQNELSGTGIESLTFPSGIMNTLALVHSFSINDDSPTLSVTSAGAFLPSYWAQFYGSTTHLIIAGQGQRVDAKANFTVESTNFLSFGLDGSAAVAEAVGSVDGYVMNSYAIDVKDDYLRVGVSISNRWFFTTEPMPIEGGIAMDTAVSTSDPVASGNSTTENYVLILSLPGLNGTEAGTMSEVGRLQLGKPNELFTALRFYDNIAYAVTFERTDPLYVLDLSVHSAPKVVSELSVLGFSSYLHSLNSDNSLMLGVGQAALANGTVTGTKLSVYNTKNPAAPFVAAEYEIQNGPDTYTSTTAVYDPKALRVVSGMNLVALPIDSWNYVSGLHFTGFWTFFVNGTVIRKECELGRAINETAYYTDPMPMEADGVGGGASGGDVAPSDPGTGGTVRGDPAVGGGGSTTSACFYCANLPSRAMVFDGSIMTVSGHFVRSHRLDTCAENGAPLDVAVAGDDNSTGSECCSPYA